MSLFFNVLSSINNPNQQGSVDQLSSVVGSLQDLASSQGIDNSQMVTMLNALGGALQPVLKDQAGALGGAGQLEGVLSKLAGSGSMAMLQAAIPPQIQQEIIQSVAQKTGVNAGMIQSMLPKLLPVITGLLGMGSTKPGVAGKNSLLDAFLNSSGQGNATDLGTVMKFANRFLNAPA